MWSSDGSEVEGPPVTNPGPMEVKIRLEGIGRPSVLGEHGTELEGSHEGVSPPPGLELASLSTASSAECALQERKRVTSVPVMLTDDKKELEVRQVVTRYLAVNPATCGLMVERRGECGDGKTGLQGGRWRTAFGF